jgi:hypothetical protein
MKRTTTGQFCIVAASVLLGAVLVTRFLAWLEIPPMQTHDKPVRRQINCINNLKQIGLAINLWALEHQGRFPFNVSTNDGGTMEFSAQGTDGFDRNAFLHLQVMSNELHTPCVLVCPRDRVAKPSVDFNVLGATNITYRLRSGTNQGPQSILIECPIDGNIVRWDGSVTELLH